MTDLTTLLELRTRTALAVARAAKRSKVSVDFEHPAQGPHHCSECRHFEVPQACELVAGAIEPGDWCELFAVMVRRDDSSDGDGSTVREARSKAVDAFSALLLTLWGKLQDGTLSQGDYRDQVQTAFRAALGDVPASAVATVEALEKKALARADSLAEQASLPEGDEDAPSEAQKRNWATMAAGALWAASLAVGAYRTAERNRDERAEQGGKAPEDVPFAVDDDEVEWHAQGDSRVCEPCAALDGKTWKLSEGGPPFWPGDPDGPCDGDDNCRCDCS